MRHRRDRDAGRCAAALLGAALLLPCACARLGFGPAAPADGGPPRADLRGGADAAPAADGAAAGGDAGPANPWRGSFSVSDPEPLSTLNSPVDEMEPHLSADGLTLYFASMRDFPSGEWEGFLATRADRTAPFADPVPNAAINTAAEETHFALSRDGLTAFVATRRAGGAGGSDVWMAVRESAATPFTPASFAPLALINTPGDEHDPEPSAGGRKLYFVTDAPAGGLGGQEIMVASRPSATGVFDALAPVANVNSTASDDNPTITSDQLVLVFASARAGGVGEKDLYYAVRASPEAPFGAPRPVPGVNTPFPDTEAHLSGDGCELFFASGRPGDRGGLDLYRARVTKTP